MLNSFLRVSVRIFFFGKFLAGIVIKKASRKQFLYVKRLLIDSRKNRAELDKIQLDKLNELLSYANRNVPYYYELFKSIGLTKTRNETVSLRRLAELKHIPFLDKDILRRESQFLMSDDHKNRGSFETTSGGSTGELAVLLQDKV